MKVLIIGLGSVALKHINALKAINKNIEIYALRSSKSANNINNVINIFSWKSVNEYKFTFVIISSPSYLHVRNLEKILHLNIPIFIEKPICTSRYQLKKLSNIKLKNLSYVACNLRFHSLIKFLKRNLPILTNEIYEINVYCGSYLPDWREKDVKETYSYQKKLGGGVHLDLIHEIDYINYLFGEPKSIRRYTNKLSNLTFDSVDYANFLMIYSRFSINLILNYYRKDRKRKIEIIGKDITIEADFERGTVKNLISNKMIFVCKENSLDSSYLDQMNYWISCIRDSKSPMNNIQEAKKIIKQVL